MPWFKVDHHMLSHPATGRAGDAALGVWLRLGCWLATFPEQGDFIPDYMAKHYATKVQIQRLVTAGLLDEVDSGYRMHRRLDISGSGLQCNAWELEEGRDGRSRAAIPASLRAAVYDRDGRACVECGVTNNLALDHIYPHSLGGEDTLDNLQTLCRSCNSRKGARV